MTVVPTTIRPAITRSSILATAVVATAAKATLTESAHKNPFVARLSWLGKMMDPVMDRVLLFTGVLGLILTGELPVWVAVFVIGRDAYLFLGGVILQRYRGRPIDVSYVGKIATALLMTGFSLMLLGLPRVEGLGLVNAPWLPGLNGTPSCLGIFVVYLGVLFSAATAIIYTGEFFKFRREAIKAGHRIDSEF